MLVKNAPGESETEHIRALSEEVKFLNMFWVRVLIIFFLTKPIFESF